MSESLIEKIKKRHENMDRTKDKGIINPKVGSSLRMNEQGDVVVASNKFVQYKLHNAQGSATEISMQSNTITNRKNIKTDEIIVNKHKLNPQLYELTDMRELNNDPSLAIGNLTMMGTVLVKTWEPALQKYVLIRRLVRVPIFSNLLNIPNTPEEMGLNDSITDELEDIRNKIK